MYFFYTICMRKNYSVVLTGTSDQSAGLGHTASHVSGIISRVIFRLIISFYRGSSRSAWFVLSEARSLSPDRCGGEKGIALKRILEPPLTAVPAVDSISRARFRRHLSGKEERKSHFPSLLFPFLFALLLLSVLCCPLFFCLPSPRTVRSLSSLPSLPTTHTHYP